MELDQRELDFIQESNFIENERSGIALEDAVLAWSFLKKQRTINNTNVLKAHKILMSRRTTIEDKYKGAFRDYEVKVGDRVCLPSHYCKVALVTLFQRIKSHIRYYDSTQYMQEKKLIEFCIQTHVDFEKIHPFGDGNGRIGRMIYNWHRLMVGLPIDVILEDEKYEYYQLFK
jgi:Fic family protein